MMWIKQITVGVLLFVCISTVLTQGASGTGTPLPVTKTPVTTPTAHVKTNISQSLSTTKGLSTKTPVVAQNTKSAPLTTGSLPANGTGPVASTAGKVGTTTRNPVKETTTVVNPKPQKNGSSSTTLPPSKGPASPTSATTKDKTSQSDKTTVKSTKVNPGSTAKSSEGGTNTSTPASKAQGAAGSSISVTPTTTQKQTPQPVTTTIASKTAVNNTDGVTSKPGTVTPTTTARDKSTTKPIPTVTVATPDESNTSTSKSNITEAPPNTSVTVTPKLTTAAANNTVTPKSTTTVPSPNSNNTVTPKPDVTSATPSTGAPTQPPTSANISSTKAPDNRTNPTAKPNTGVPVTKPTSTAAPGTISKGPSTPATSHDKVYINEIMVDKNGGFQTIELLIPAAADLTHYAMVIVDGGTTRRQVYNLKADGQQKNNVLIIPINSTLHVMKDNGTGIAVYDTNMVNVTDTNWDVSRVGLMDALVIGKTYAVSAYLSGMISAGDYPFVIDPALLGKLKTISRCSGKSLMTADMFILTDASLGENNTDKCQAKMSKRKTLVLKIDAKCSTIDPDTAKDIMKYFVREVNKNCHCGITGQHVKDIKISCCQETLLKIQFVIPSDSSDKHLVESYKTFIDTAPRIQVAQNTYQTDKNCDDYKACCQQYKCCEQPKPLTQDDTTKNVRVTVAAVVSCLLIFMIIVVLVIIYMKRKKTVNYQFRMSRLHEDDDNDLMMDQADADDFVGGQEATFDIKA